MGKKTVLVTGSSRGIGLAIAERFALNGHRVALHCRKDADRMQEQESRLKKQGCSVMSVQGDIGSETDVQRFFNEIRCYFGPVEILVNNAGVALPEQLLTDCSLKQIDSVLDTNIRGTLLCCKEATLDMVSKKRGSIVNISSYLGVIGCSCETPYATSKAAVIGLTKSLAKELAPAGIRVNCVAPGYVQTEMNAAFSEKEREWIRNEIPLERFGLAEDMAKAVEFLAFEETAGYITGQILCVDGGSSL